MIEEFILRIRRQKNGFYVLLYRMAKTLSTLRLPAPRPLFVALYYLRELILTSASELYRIFWADPLFRSRCATVGRGLHLIGGVPCICGRLMIHLGKNVTVHGRSSFTANRVYDFPALRVGDHTYLGYELIISVGREVTIGRNCLIGDRVIIFDQDGHPLDPDARRRGESVPSDHIRPVVIEDDVWIGSRAIILKGVKIGRGAIVGAGSVVTSDVPPDAVACGNPARVVKQWSATEEPG
jgi:acetyltransferase-like isoleucine patch superfamily enzyme